MRVFLVDPVLTTGERPDLRAWHAALGEELEKYLDVLRVSTRVQLAGNRPSRQDVIVFFNRADQDYESGVLGFLEEGHRAGARILPIGFAEDSLKPPAVVPDAQSFDVPAHLRQRDLPASSAVVLARVLGRRTTAVLRPTLCKEHMQIFLSYRRFDGERVAEAFDRMLRIRAEAVFRDRVDVRTGDDAQEVISERLRQSDLVIFVDTPRTGDSSWIAKELATALGLQLPIIWIRFGGPDGRVPLAVAPGREPHLAFGDVPASADEVPAGLVEEVLRKAADVADETALRVFSQLRKLLSLTDTKQVVVREIDREHLVYAVSIPHRACSPFQYPHRPITHIVQLFNRWPLGSDESLLSPHLDRIGGRLHDVFGLPYDAAVLLAPIPPQSYAPETVRPLYVDSVEEYVDTLARYVSSGKSLTRSGLIISGAFPETEPEHEQHLTDAIHAFVRAALDRGWFIIFGNHPTFRPLITEVARRRAPKEVRSLVRLYTSAYFVAPAEEEQLKQDAEVILTPSVADDRAQSLTAMRRAMVQDREAVGLVAIGGRSFRPGIAPGVDEEIDLARAARLPVFVVGSVGGRTSQLAARYSEAGWKPQLNQLTNEENDRLRTSLDFDELAALVIGSLDRGR